jgi:hypothetical protein
MTVRLDLLDALDIAAAHLLEKAGVGATMENGTIAKEAPLTEQVKAFEAVVDWAKTRKDLRPPKKEESRFDGIKRQFNGTAIERGGSKSKKKAHGSLDGTSSPSTGTDINGTPALNS